MLTITIKHDVISAFDKPLSRYVDLVNALIICMKCRDEDRASALGMHREYTVSDDSKKVEQARARGVRKRVTGVKKTANR